MVKLDGQKIQCLLDFLQVGHQGLTLPIINVLQI